MTLHEKRASGADLTPHPSIVGDEAKSGMAREAPVTPFQRML
jgi:hypothetical protein